MTADAERGELAAALVAAQWWSQRWTDAHDLADALLPVVDEIAGKRAAEAEAKVQRVSLWADLLDDDMRALGYTDGHPAATAIRAVLDAES